MTTLDAGGIDVGVSDPFPPDGSGAEGGGSGALTKTVPFITPIEGGGAKCILDGLEIECSRISGNSSVQCPNNDCNATVTLVWRSHGRVVATSKQPAPDGWDPSYDGTYVFNDSLPWRRKGGDPPYRRNGPPRYNHAIPASPQKPDRRLTENEYSTVRSELAKALKSDKCRDFIDRLVGYNNGAPYDSAKNFLGLSDYIYNSSDGGVFWGSPSQVGNKVRIGSDIRPDLNALGNAAILMHELIHRLQRRGGADDELSRNIRDLGIVPVDKKGEPLRFPTGMRDGKPFNDFSPYWDTALHNACFPKLEY
jgi:hypothetical protein